MRARRQAEFGRDRLGDVGEARARADRPRRRAGAEGQDRHVLAGVVEAPVGRVVAVVGGDAGNSRSGRIAASISPSRDRSFEAGGEAGNVAAMAPFGVEIDEVDEDQPALGRVLQRSRSRSTLPSLLLPLRSSPGVAMGENVADLADRDDGAAGARRRAASSCRPAAAWRSPCGCGASEILRRSRRGTAARSPGRCSRDRTVAGRCGNLVEPLEPEHLLVRGDLEHRIGRGVADRLSGPNAPRRSLR